MTIALEEVEKCPLCESYGETKYNGLFDNVFGVKGLWTIKTCNNKECELLWLSPRPKLEELYKVYSNYYTHEKYYNNDNILKFIIKQIRQYYCMEYIKYIFKYKKNNIKRLILELIAIILPGGPDSYAINGLFLPYDGGIKKLLEVGCGSGEMLIQMSKLGWIVRGLEFDPKCVKNVRELRIECDLGDLRDQNYPSNHYDALYIGNVLEHVVEPKLFISECARIIKPGGRIVCLTPNSKSLGSNYFGRNWRGLEVPRHLTLFNIKNITKIFRGNNLELEIIKTSNRGAWYIFGMSILIKNTNITENKNIAPGISKNSIKSIFTQYFGRIINYIYKGIGEEIVIVAIKKLG